MSSNFDKLKDFHRVFDNGYKDPNIENKERILLRGKLMLEELQEVLDELGLHIVLDQHYNPIVQFDVYKQDKPIDKTKVAKELADLLYVTYGSAETMDIPMDEVFAEVHRSNMSKMHPDGTVRHREDGKILKGDWYSPANVEGVLKKHVS